MSIYIQFDGETTDIDKMEKELLIVGIKIISIRRSRWRGLALKLALICEK